MHRFSARWAAQIPLLLVIASGCVSAPQRAADESEAELSKEGTPAVVYDGPEEKAASKEQGGPTEPVLLFQKPDLQYVDEGHIRLTCDPGCTFNTASAALRARLKQAGMQGVHSLTETSGKVQDSMEYVAENNQLVYALSGTVFGAE